MEALNLRKIKPYDYTVESGKEEQRIHFYCISEGATEETYLYGVRNSRAELHIKNEVYIQVVEKEVGQETYSHPLQLVKAALVQMGIWMKMGTNCHKVNGTRIVNGRNTIRKPIRCA